MAKRILVIGAGAVGGYVGGHLARDGHDVLMFDPWPEHVEAMRANGLALAGTTPEENFTVPVRALHMTELQGLVRERPADIVLLCVKSYDTAWATEMVRDYLAPDGFVVSLQNCINEERIAGIVGWGRVVGCIAAKIVVELEAPGRIRRNVAKGGASHTVFRIGEVHGRITPRIQEVAGWLEAIDSVKVTTNLWGERWSKLVANAMANGISAASGMSGPETMRETITRRLSIRVAGEAVVVGRALGFDLETINGFAPDDWVAAGSGDAATLDRVESSLLAGLDVRSDRARPSMGQDVLKGRRTEIDFINGHIVRKGEEVGIDAPANRGVTEAVRAIERGRLQPSLDVVRDL